MTACERISYDIEGNPDRYMRQTFTPLLDTVRGQLAELLGADADECVMVANATHGVNTILRNLDWSQSDVIVGTTVTYGAISRTIQYIADSNPHPQLVPLALVFPNTVANILQQFREHLKNIPRKPGRRIVVIIDAIVSNPGIRMPWEALVKICKEEDVISVVDAAHSIGQQVDINLKVADPDFWVSNCHKWLYAKRGCAVMYVPKRNQHLIRTTLPTSFDYVSPVDPPGHPEAPNFVAQFHWTGTIDPAPFLSVTHALEFRKWLGGEKKINDYCHNLALLGGKRLAEILGTSLMDESGELTANMVNVGLPLRVEGSDKTYAYIRSSLLNDWNMFAAPFHHNDSWWIRCSAQVFNEMSDFDKLGEGLVNICRKVEALV